MKNPSLHIDPLRPQGLSYLPKWVSNKALMVYFAALAIVTMMYLSYSLPWYFILSGAISVIGFFYLGNILTRKWSIVHIRSIKRFERTLFWVAFAIRAAYVLLIYAVFMNTYGDPFGFENADAYLYDTFGREMAKFYLKGDYHLYENSKFILGNDGIDDMGYGCYLGFVYLISGNSILFSRILKCIWSAFTCLLVYRLAKRNFGESVGRMAGIFCMLWPNFWYYCGCQLKETEMVFLATLYVEQADQMLRSRRFTVWKVAPVLFLASLLFTFRTALGMVAVLTLLFAVVMSSSRVVGWGKRIALGVLAVALIGVTMGNRLQEEAQQLVDTVQSDNQQNNMEWRSRRANGNKFAKYAGKAVFAPLIFSIPFPTMVRPFEGQYVQQLLNGGNFTKNILSFFVILAMFMFLFNGAWRDHLIPTAFLLGYMVVLALSVFAQAERFHQPAMPMAMLFAAYGISQAMQGVPVYKHVGRASAYKQWFLYWTLFMFVACLGWNWFKLAGRGMI